MSLNDREQGSQQTSDQQGLLSSDCSVAVKKIAEQQQAFFEVISQIRASLDLETIFQVTATEVRQLLNVDRVGVFRFYPESGFDDGEFVSEAVLPEFTSALAARIHDHCFGDRYAVDYANGRIQVVHDIDQARLSDCHAEVLTRFQIKAQLIVPLLQGNQLWGLLCIHQCAAPRDWQTDEIQFVSRIAEHLGVALQQAELLHRTRQQAERQKALSSVVKNIRASLDLNTTFKATATEVRQLLNADRVGVFRFYPESGFDDGEFVSESVLPPYASALAAKIHDHCFGDRYAAHYIQGRIQAVADIHQAELSDCHIQVLSQFQIRANLIVPLLQGEQLWGLLCIHQCAAPRHWQPDEIDFVTHIAEHLGIALQQAELLHQTRQQTHAISSTLHELQQAQTKLIQTEKMSSLGQLVAGVAHEINNPVNFIYGNLNHATGYIQDLLELLDLYQEHYPNPVRVIQQRSDEVDLDFLAEDLPKIITSMKTGADRIRQIVLSLRSFSRFDQAEMKAVDVHEGIDSTLMILQHRLKAKSDQAAIQVIKQYGLIPPVECFAGQLNQVFMNLLSNAIDALQEGTPEANPQPMITISTHLVKDAGPIPTVLMKIADNGSGIPAGVCERIFDPFFTTKPIGKGTGLGLSISYQIVTERHGGSLRCFSHPGEGTEFQIEIPLTQVEVPQVNPV